MLEIHFDVELVGLAGGDALVDGGLEAVMAVGVDEFGVGGVVEDGEGRVVLHDAIDFVAPGEIAGGEDEAPGAHFADAFGLAEFAGAGVEFALGEDAVGGLIAGDEDAEDMAFGVAHRAVAPGPVDVFEVAVAEDGDKLIFVPGGLTVAHDEVDTGLDGGPGFSPAIAGGLTEGAGVTSSCAEGGAVGVVVELDGVRTPPKKHGVMRGEEEIYAGEEGIVPGVDGAERCGGPIKGTDKVGHFAGAEDAAGGRCGRVGWWCRSGRACVHRRTRFEDEGRKKAITLFDATAFFEDALSRAGWGGLAIHVLGASRGRPEGGFF